MAPRDAKILAKESGRDEAGQAEQIQAFAKAADGYQPKG
jgi:hypothetical protein